MSIFNSVYGVSDETIDHAVAEGTLKSFLAPSTDYELLCVETSCAMKKPDDKISTTVAFKIIYHPDATDNKIKTTKFVGKFNKRKPIYPALNAIIKQEFMKDVMVPKVVLPCINRYLIGDSPLIFPAIYYDNLQQGQEAIVTQDVAEDLVFKDYMHKDLPMDENHAVVVLKALANFHAASFVFESKEKQMDTKFAFYKDESFSTSNSEFLNAAVEGYVDSSAEVLECSDKVKASLPNWKKVVNWIRENKTSSLKTFTDEFKPSPKFRTITHGNAYGSKMTFKYNNKEEPVAVCLSDFSQSKLGSVAVDINFFLFTSVNRDLMAKVKLSELLKQYFETYQRVCDHNHTTLLFTLDDLVEEIIKKMLIGWYAGLNVLPAYLGGEAFAPNMEDFNRDRLFKFIMDNRIKLHTLINTNQEFANRYIGMYKTLLEYKKII